MISLIKKSVLDSVLAATLGAVCAFAASDAHAAAYQIRVGEETVGDLATAAAYSNGIIKSYATPVDDQSVPSQSADFAYSSDKTTKNGVVGDYHVSASVSPVHGGTLHVHASGDGGFSGLSAAEDGRWPYPEEGYAGAIATMAYDFEVTGPASTTPIPVSFYGKANLTTVGQGTGYGYLEVYTGSSTGNPLAVDWIVDGSTSYDAVGETIYLMPNVPIGVNASISVYSESIYGTGAPFDPTQDSGSADGFIDPTFALTGQYANLYHIEGVPAEPATGAVPEPSTWAMILLGFAGLGCVGYRKARNGKAAFAA